MRKFYLKAHSYLALFFIPFIFIFIITGVLHLLGSKESILKESKFYGFTQNQSFKSLDGKQILLNAIPKDIKLGEYSIKKKKYLQLESSDLIASLKPAKNGYEVMLSEKTIFGKLLALHKGKQLTGKIMVYGFGTGLVLLSLSGFLMLRQMRNKKELYVGLILGAICVYLLYIFT